MKTYPKYKESGIPWMGKIPEEWQVIKIRQITSAVFTGNSPVYEFEPSNRLVFGQRNNQKLGIDMNGIKYAEEKFYASRSLDEFLHYGDILLNTLGGGSVGRIGFFNLPYENVITDGHVMIIRGNEKCCQRYLYYSLYSQQNIFEEAAVGSTNQAFLTVPQINQWKIVLPPLAEQQAIAEYLDKKTGDIDELVGLLNKQIADVRAYRQSLITETVTQGLNKDVPMKDSGIEWIGQIPEGWKVSKFKQILCVNGRVGYRGYTTADLVEAGQGAYTIGGKHITHCKLDLSDADYISWDKYYESPEIMVQKGDIVMAQRGTLGKVALISEEIGPATINPSLVLLNHINISNIFVYYYLMSSCTKLVIDMINTATAVPMISQSQIENMPIPVPPLPEQQQIVEFLDAKTKDIDELLSKLEAQVSDLLAYKSSLISEVVTGKIDIR